MRATFSIGRIAGVRVGVHWSVLVIFAVIALGLAEGRLPATHPGHSAAVYWALGLAAAVAFFMSLLAHELAHAVLARRNGIEVDDIVLWLLGGVARLKGEAPTPGAELRIAGVGPAVSLVLGGVFALAAWLAHLGSGSGPVVDALVWLAVINLLLGVFNALPAAPLDGGRLLRAFVWWRTGDRLRATTTATNAGRGFGWALALFGLVLVVRGDTFGGVWMALIGWFLVASATAEGRQARLRETLAGVPVRLAMTPDPVTVPADVTVGAFLLDPRYRYRHVAFPVTGPEGDAVGMVTLDAARAVPDAHHSSVRVADVMLRLEEVTTTTPDAPLADLLPSVEPGAERRVLVLEGTRVAGIVSPSDVTRTVTWLMNTHPPGRAR